MTISHSLFFKQLGGGVIAAVLICGPAFAQGVPLGQAKLSGDEIIQTPIGDIHLEDSYFDDAASKRLYDEMNYQRAAQAYIWSMPLVSVVT